MNGVSSHVARSCEQVPPESSGKRRGGRRLRKMKERMGMTHMRQLSNRVRFGQEEDMTSDGMLGVGMLGKSQQGGKVKVNAQKQQLLSEKNKRAPAPPESARR